MDNDIIESLKRIYSKIPDFNCKHCGKCCECIIWSEPEDILIREFMEKNKINRITWTMKEFEEHQMKCPYLVDDRCIIYPVRPIVCRLQGNVKELKCWMSSNPNQMSEKQLEDIKNQFFDLLRRANCLDHFYSTRKIEFKQK